MYVLLLVGAVFAVASLVGGVVGYYIALPLLSILTIAAIFISRFMWKREIETSKVDPTKRGSGYAAVALSAVVLTLAAAWSFVVMWIVALYLRSDALSPVLHSVQQFLVR